MIMHNTSEQHTRPRPKPTMTLRSLQSPPRRRRVPFPIVLIRFIIALGVVIAGFILWATKGGV